jgi:hypothetical protein
MDQFGAKMFELWIKQVWVAFIINFNAKIDARDFSENLDDRSAIPEFVSEVTDVKGRMAGLFPKTLGAICNTATTKGVSGT